MHETWTELLVFMAEKQPETHHQKRIPGKVKRDFLLLGHMMAHELHSLSAQVLGWREKLAALGRGLLFKAWRA